MWQTILWSVLGVVVTGLVSWGVERITAFLNAKIKNAKALKYLTDAVNIVANAVKVTYQTYVEAIKGTDLWTAEAQTTALSQAVESATTQMSNEVKNYIAENFGDVSSWIVSQVEATLYDLKK